MAACRHRRRTSEVSLVQRFSFSSILRLWKNLLILVALLVVHSPFSRCSARIWKANGGSGILRAGSAIIVVIIEFEMHDRLLTNAGLRLQRCLQISPWAMRHLTRWARGAYAGLFHHPYHRARLESLLISYPRIISPLTYVSSDGQTFSKEAVRVGFTRDGSRKGSRLRGWWKPRALYFLFRAYVELLSTQRGR